MSDLDKTLFNEAAVSALNGASRGAYILLWISAAEGLKRKFKEAAIRDSRANTIVGLIRDVEAARKSADMLILDHAKGYGFVDDALFQSLKHVYDLRCLYGHPYESAPSDIELIAAAEVVVDGVLGKPTTLKQGFVQRQIELLFTDPNYLEQSALSVSDFANDMSDRVDPVVFSYMLDSYSAKIEAAYKDASLSVVVRRGVWFLSAFLSKVGTSFYTPSQWHEYLSKYPNTGQYILLSRHELFESIGLRGKDYIISFLLNESTSRPSLLLKLERLYERGLLNEAQAASFKTTSLTSAFSAGLKITSCFGAVIEAFKTHNWYAQNPAASYVGSSPRRNILALTLVEQEILGRNILQAANGGSGQSSELLASFVHDQTDISEEMVKGIIFECFLDEESRFRLKLEQIDQALQLLITRPNLAMQLCSLIGQAEIKTNVTSTNYVQVLAAVGVRPELSALSTCLLSNRDRLVNIDINPDMEVPF